MTDTLPAPWGARGSATAEPTSEEETVVQPHTEIPIDAPTALADRQFELVYQPIYDLDAPAAPVGLEALLRWNHPDLGQLPPDRFVPGLVSSGAIVEVGRWVLAEACRHVARWHASGHDLLVSVNVSSRQFDTDDIVDDVFDALYAAQVVPSALTVEVPQSALTHNVEATARRLHALKEFGVQIAIDDFGTSYTSVSYLRQFPIDCLKIDRRFIQALTRSPQAAALIQTLVQLGRDLGLRTLAEGVETAAQLAHLREQDVQGAQGFLLARPMTVAAIDDELGQRVPVPSAEG
jgi:EAL domain-containing protein (putative c-di-GMP-specific phosphodiesterase class I)